MTDTERLNERIDDSGLKIGWILEKLGIKSYSTLQAKIENRQEFKASEIAKLTAILHLNTEEMDSIFFAENAESHSA